MKRLGSLSEALQLSQTKSLRCMGLAFVGGAFLAGGGASDTLAAIAESFRRGLLGFFLDRGRGFCGRRRVFDGETFNRLADKFCEGEAEGFGFGFPLGAGRGVEPDREVGSHEKCIYNPLAFGKGFVYT
jgi:hypothetical protein